VAASVLPALKSTRLVDQLRERVRYLHYSHRTEQACVDWSKAFIRFHRLRHPVEMGKPEMEEFLSWLASERKVAASTHAQALSALLFLYGKVLCQELPWLQDIGRPRIHRRLPVILSPDELACIFGAMVSVNCPVRSTTTILAGRRRGSCRSQQALRAGAAPS
jgi:hypothetical protein